MITAAVVLVVFLFGFVVAAMLASGRIADLEYELLRVRAENARLLEDRVV